MPQQTQAPVTLTPSKDSFKLQSHDQEGKERLEQQLPVIRDTMERARAMLLQGIPELRSVLERPGMQVVVVDDIDKAWREKYHSDPHKHEDTTVQAFTHTEVDPQTHRATGTTIFLSSALFQTHRLQGTDVVLQPVPRVIAVLDHELQHCKQTIHPPNGQVVGEMSLGRREHEAYEGEIRDLMQMYKTIGNLDVRDYRKQFNRPDLDGELIVDEKVNFREIASNAELMRRRYAEMMITEAQTAGAGGAMPTLPKAGGRSIPPGAQGGVEFTVPKDSPYFASISAAIDSGLSVVTTDNPRIPFQIYDKDRTHLLRNVIASSHAKTPEQLAQVLSLQLQGERDKQELFTLLNAQGWGFQAQPHETGQPVRNIDILEHVPGGPPGPEGFRVRTTVHIKPDAKNSDVLEIGDDLYQAWESDLLREVKKLIPAK